MMREPRYIFSNEHIRHYKKSVEASEPLADFDDRNAIYAMFVPPPNSRLLLGFDKR